MSALLDKQDGLTPLSMASAEGHGDVLKQLLDHDADVDLANNAQQVYILQVASYSEIGKQNAIAVGLFERTTRYCQRAACT